MRPGRALRDSEDARYVGLCMPRVLARLPYGAKSEPVEEFAFEEDTDGHKGEKYAWMNAAYAMAANINRAFKEYGWCARIRGVQSGGEVDDLPTHTFPTDDGGVDLKCPTEIAISDRREDELAKSGLIPLIHRKNTDKAAFIGAQSVYKPKDYQNKVRRRRRRQSVGASALHVRGVALRALPEVHGARQDRLDEEKEELRALAAELDQRICRRRSEQLDGGDEVPPALGQARKSTIVPNEENPGYYSRDLLPAAALPARGHGYRL